MNQSKLPQKQDPLCLDIDTISVDDIRLLYSLGVPIVCNINPNNRLFVALQIKSFMCRMDRARLLSINYWESTTNHIKYVRINSNVNFEFRCQDMRLTHNNSGNIPNRIDIKWILKQIEDLCFEHPDKFRAGSNKYFKE